MQEARDACEGASAVVLAAAALPATANVCEAASSGSCEEREAKLPPDALRTNGRLLQPADSIESSMPPAEEARGSLSPPPLPPLFLRTAPPPAAVPAPTPSGLPTKLLRAFVPPSCAAAALSNGSAAGAPCAEAYGASSLSRE